MNNYLVFESQAPPDHSGAPTQFNPRTNQMEVIGNAPLFGYTCIAAVRAKDTTQAVQAVMGRTRRIGKYAVIEAEFIDFTSSPFQDAEGEAPQLNP